MCEDAELTGALNIQRRECKYSHLVLKGGHDTHVLCNKKIVECLNGLANGAKTAVCSQSPNLQILSPKP